MCYGYHIWSKEALMQAENDDDLDGGQRSSEVKWVNYVLWLPYFVKRSADANWEWWWPLWRSKVIRGQMWWTMWYGYHIWSKEPLMQAENDDDLHGGQRSSEVKYNMCHGYHIWSKELLMQVTNDDDLHGGQKSSEVKCGKLCYQTWSEEQLMQI